MSSATASWSPEIAELLREAAAWRLIGVLLECPGEGWLAEVAALAGEAGAEDLEAAARAAAEERADEAAYHTTFGPGGPAAPRAASYRDALHAGRTLGELRTLYDAFAYRPASLEPPDHVAVVAGFVGYLRFKAAYALGSGRPEQAAVASEAAAHVAAQHLAPMGRPLAQTLARGGSRSLALAARALADRLPEPAAGLPLVQPEETEGCDP